MAGNIYQVLQLKNVFSELEKKYDIALHFITDLEYYHYAGVYGKRITEDIVNGLCKNVHIYEWDQKTFSDIVCSCDIAVIPIDLNNPLTKGKPENKLLLFWRMGMPTITSATTTYSLAMKKAGIDLTCYDNDDWFIALEKCILDEDYRRSVGINGKRFADSEYSDEMIYKQWDKLFIDLIEG
jgi:glycosyltransferase involved in cell wall biosynthesis